VTQQTVVTVALTRQRARLLRLAYGSYFRSRRMDPQARAHIVKLPELLRGRNDQASSTHKSCEGAAGQTPASPPSSSMLLCPGTPLNRFDRRPVKKERSLTPSINLRGTIKALQCPKTTGTGFSHAKQPRTADRDKPYLGLLHLMIDLEVLSAELQVAEEAIGRPSWAYRESVTDRLMELPLKKSRISALGRGPFLALLPSLHATKLT
jgi:hypothetical protein